MNAIFRGEAGFKYTASSAVSAGDIVIANKLVGVASRDIAAGSTDYLRTNGRFTVVKSGSSGPVFAQGAFVYWDTANKTAVASSGENIVCIGRASSAAAASDASVEVILYQLIN